MRVLVGSLLRRAGYQRVILSARWLVFVLIACVTASLLAYADPAVSQTGSDDLMNGPMLCYQDDVLPAADGQDPSVRSGMFLDGPLHDGEAPRDYVGMVRLPDNPRLHWRVWVDNLAVGVNDGFAGGGVPGGDDGPGPARGRSRLGC